ncbi:SDR family oxidoreductase [Legionella dresdenensis]|uniref:SDR family oxidoreductase n=1 Tax=Legionella dresdenensis TaxID=450200 RepID=A0ABV8CHN2_9GAMM
MAASFLIFGLGYTARALAPVLEQQGFSIIGTTRNLEKPAAAHLETVTLIDFFDPDIEQHINQASHILVTIPPAAEIGDIVLHHYADLIKRRSTHIQWLGYLSSTGVYGDHQGKWVNENSPCFPESATALARMEAEQRWLSFADKWHLPLHIFRLAGIYGPGRNALERLVSGKQDSIYKQGHVFSRIHVDDIVSVLLASMTHIHPLSIYNIADDEPAPSHVIDAYAAALLHREPLPLINFEEAALSPRLKEFYSDNRRISNQKIKEELKIKLKYPTFREGLKSIKVENRPGLR